MEKRQQAFKVLKEIHKFSHKLNLNCLEVCDGRCEAGALLLVPYEHEFIKASIKSCKELFPLKSFSGSPCGFIPEDGEDCRGLCNDKKTCSFWPYIPIDCLTFPIFPKFNDNKIMFFVSKLCPLWNTLPPEYKKATKEAWEAIHALLTPEWKQCYNSKVVPFFDSDKATEIVI